MSTENNPSAAPAAAPAPVTNVSTLPNVPAMPTVNVAKALGLPESPTKTLNRAINQVKKDAKIDQGFARDPEPAPEPKKKNEPPKNTPKNDSPAPSEKDEGEVPAAAAPEASKDTPPAAPAAPASKEFDELKNLIKEQAKQIDDLKKANTPAPAAEPVKKAETDEEKAQKTAKRQEARKKEVDFHSKNVPVNLTDKDVDQILEGGEQAVSKMKELLGSVYAEAIMQTREGLEKDLNPILEHIYSNMEQFNPVYDDYQQLQRLRIEEGFKGLHPDLKDRMDIVKSVAKTLYDQYPQQLDKMKEPEIFNMVAEQTRAVLKSFGVSLTPAAAPAPVAPVPAPVAAAPAPEPVKPVARPPAPATNTPGVTSTPGSKSSIHKSIAESLTW
jgi:hypothetical protein